MAKADKVKIAVNQRGSTKRLTHKVRLTEVLPDHVADATTTAMPIMRARPRINDLGEFNMAELSSDLALSAPNQDVNVDAGTRQKALKPRIQLPATLSRSKPDVRTLITLPPNAPKWLDPLDAIDRREIEAERVASLPKPDKAAELAAAREECETAARKLGVTPVTSSLAFECETYTWMLATLGSQRPQEWLERCRRLSRWLQSVDCYLSFKDCTTDNPCQMKQLCRRIFYAQTNRDN